MLCFDEESNTDWYMQFHIPAKSERVLPTKLTVEEEAILVEHARPYAFLQTGSIRPPAEETMHEHWKNASRLAPSDRKDRSNFIAHVENNFASLQRISLVRVKCHSFLFCLSMGMLLWINVCAPSFKIVVVFLTCKTNSREHTTPMFRIRLSLMTSGARLLLRMYLVCVALISRLSTSGKS